jgi:hypothetical protein
MEIYDDDESFCDGDTPLDDIDWDAVVRLERLQAEALDADDVPMAMLGLLHELHGDDLQVL